MVRTLLACVALVVLLSPASSADISGDYLESRTCDIFTGPCFANSELGLAGQTAIMAWKIDQGRHNDVNLAGLSVVVAIKAENTLAIGGGMKTDPGATKSVILVDARATASQRAALADFARQRAGRYGRDVARVDFVPIDMQLDHQSLAAKLTAGKEVRMATRKISGADLCCTNEEIYYPPLASVENYAPAYTLDGAFNGRGLGARWENPNTRSAFLATFAY